VNPLEWDAPWFLVALGLFVIVMARANGTYWLGRLGVSQGRRTRLARWLDSPGYDRASAWVDRWGAPAVTISFLTIGIQTLVNLAAGASRMSLRRYLPAVVAGCIIWAVVYATIGVVGWQAVAWAWERSPGGVGVTAALLAAAAGAWVMQRRTQVVDPQ